MFSLKLFIAGMPKKSPMGLRSGARDTSAIKPKSLHVFSMVSAAHVFKCWNSVAFFVAVVSEAYEGYFECFAAHAFSSTVFVLGRF